MASLSSTENDTFRKRADKKSTEFNSSIYSRQTEFSFTHVYSATALPVVLSFSLSPCPPRTFEARCGKKEKKRVFVYVFCWSFFLFYLISPPSARPFFFPVLLSDLLNAHAYTIWNSSQTFRRRSGTSSSFLFILVSTVDQEDWQTNERTNERTNKRTDSGCSASIWVIFDSIPAS